MNSPATPDKRTWREIMRARRRSVPAPERAAAGRLLAAAICKWPLLRRGAWVATYLSLPDELPADAVNAALQEMGCRLAAPAWSIPENGYRFAAWRAGDPLGAGPMRVPEPLTKHWVPTETIDVFLVPGLAFDDAGGRIGFGKGHYDRLLAARRSDSLCVALGYDWQRVARVPQAPGDIRMDWIATPQGVARVAPADALR